MASLGPGLKRHPKPKRSRAKAYLLTAVAIAEPLTANTSRKATNRTQPNPSFTLTSHCIFLQGVCGHSGTWATTAFLSMLVYKTEEEKKQRRSRICRLHSEGSEHLVHPLQAKCSPGQRASVTSRCRCYWYRIKETGTASVEAVSCLSFLSFVFGLLFLMPFKKAEEKTLLERTFLVRGRVK